MKTNFHENLKILLKERKLSQTVFAYMLGVSQPTISTWCNGTREPSIQDICKICETLNICPNELFEWEETHYKTKTSFSAIGEKVEYKHEKK